MSPKGKIGPASTSYTGFLNVRLDTVVATCRLGTRQYALIGFTDGTIGNPSLQILPATITLFVSLEGGQPHTTKWEVEA